MIDTCSTWWQTYIPTHQGGWHLCALFAQHDGDHICDCGSEYAA